MRDFTSNGTNQCQNGSSNLLTPHLEQSRPTRIVVAYRLTAVPFSPLHFSFAVWRIRCPCPCLPLWVVLRCLYGCLSSVACEGGHFSSPTRIICGCLSFISLLFDFCFLVFSSESFGGYFHTRFLLSAFFPVCLFCFVFSDRFRSQFVLV